MSLEDCLFNRLMEEQDAYEPFMRAIETVFSAKKFTVGHPPLVHTVKSRLKSEASIRDKIQRKIKAGVELTADNVFDEVADYAGVRVLHLHNGQFQKIHEHFTEYVNSHYFLDGSPEAYSWDSNLSSFYQGLGIKSKVKESYYTSVHYTVRPRSSTYVRCEIQIRTLFEEIWGEIDHTINYPYQCESDQIREQLRAFSKLVACGSTLASGILMAQAGE